MPETSDPSAPPADGGFVITRTFDAPRERVFEAWTDLGRLRRWFGPQGMTMAACTMDLRPGGVFHYCLRMPDGHEMWGKWVFLDIAPPGRLVVISSFSDAAGGMTRHPMAPAWPLQTLSTTTFEAQDGRTLLTVRWSAHDATPQERQTFDASHAAMRQGWGGTLDRLAACLEEDAKERAKEHRA